MGNPLGGARASSSWLSRRVAASSQFARERPRCLDGAHGGDRNRRESSAHSLEGIAERRAAVYRGRHEARYHRSDPSIQRRLSAARPTALQDLVADDCVLENTNPAPDGARYEGHDACVGFWQQLAADRSLSFELEDVIVAGERATILWRLRFGEGHQNSVRGVNLIQVRDGKIVEALGYVKAG